MTQHNTASGRDESNKPSPWFTSLYDLYTHFQTATKKRGFTHVSNRVLRVLSAPETIHVLHIKPEDEPDQLLRLHMFVHAALSNSIPGSPAPVGALVICDSKTSNNEGFNQAFWVVKQHFKSTAQSGIFQGSGYNFNNIVILLRGVTDGSSSSNAVARVQTSLKRLVDQAHAFHVIWHECTTISLLATMVRDVKSWCKSFGQAPLGAAVITNGLSMDRSELRTGSGLSDPETTISFLAHMASIQVPVLFADAYMLGINSRLDVNASSSPNEYYHHSTLLPNFNRAFPCLLPAATYESIMKTNMDDLVIHTFRLAAKHNGISDDTVIDLIKQEFRRSRSNWWAKRLVCQNEYTSQRCQRSVATHLINIIVNADVPLDFRLTALPSALVDRGQSINDLTVLPCEIDLSGPKLRFSNAPKNPLQVYVLVSQSTKSVTSRLHTDWQSTVRTVTPAGQLPSIDQTVARQWLYMIKKLHKQIGGLHDSKDFDKLKDEEQYLLKRIMWALLNGNMSQIATAALGSTPYEFWK